MVAGPPRYGQVGHELFSFKTPNVGISTIDLNYRQGTTNPPARTFRVTIKVVK